MESKNGEEPVREGGDDEWEERGAKMSRHLLPLPRLLEIINPVKSTKSYLSTEAPRSIPKVVRERGGKGKRSADDGQAATLI